MKKKIVIIGGGMAGLAAGIYALNSGFDAEIYEKNIIAGGECMGWNRKGYHIDNCIHWLTGTKEGTDLWEVWKKLGAIDEETTYAKVESFYTSRYQGQEATFWNDLEKTQKELIALAPEDEEEIRKFVEHVRYAQECYIPAAKPMDMMKIKDYVNLGKRMMNMPKVMKEYGKEDIHDLSMRFHSPILRKLFTDYLPAEYTAYSFLVSYGTMTGGNGSIPIGGSLPLLLKIVKRYQTLGGKLYLNQNVDHILTERGKAIGIQLEDGKEIHADYVISAVDTDVLFHRFLNPSYILKDWEKAYEDRKNYPITSGFQAAFAIDNDFSKENTVFFEGAPFQIGTRTFQRIHIKNYGYDSSFAPQGKAVLQTCVTQTDADYFFWKGLSEEEYRQEKERLVQLIEEKIEKEFPELKGKMELLDCWTPLTYERYCNAYHGAYMSFVTTKNTPALKCKGTVKGLKNLYIAGQWIQNPGGLPIAAISGKFAIQRILKSEHKSINI